MKQCIVGAVLHECKRYHGNNFPAIIPIQLMTPAEAECRVECMAFQMISLEMYHRLNDICYVSGHNTLCCALLIHQDFRLSYSLFFVFFLQNFSNDFTTKVCSYVSFIEQCLCLVQTLVNLDPIISASATSGTTTTIAVVPHTCFSPPRH